MCRHPPQPGVDSIFARHPPNQPPSTQIHCNNLTDPGLFATAIIVFVA